MKNPNSPAKIPKPVKSVKNGTKAVDMPQINIQKAYRAFRFIHDWSPSHPLGAKKNNLMLDLLKISRIILSYPLVDCFEFNACLASRCLCSQNINKYSKYVATKKYKRKILRF